LDACCTEAHAQAGSVATSVDWPDAGIILMHEAGLAASTTVLPPPGPGQLAQLQAN